MTGATGFIGGHAERMLGNAGHEIIRLARSGADLNLDVRYLSPDSAPAVDAIVHLAGFADAGDSDANPHKVMSSNAVGTMRVLEVARRQQCRTIIASSMRVYSPSTSPLFEDTSPTEPRDAYGLSKLTAEMWARIYGQAYRLPVTTLRFFSVYGPGQALHASGSGVVSIFAHRALAGQNLMVYHRQARDFVNVDDASRSILAAMGNEREGSRTYNIATGVSTTIEELARLVVHAAGGRSSLDLAMAKRPGDSYIADGTRAREELGYVARISLAQGVKEYIEWLTTGEATG